MKRALTALLAVALLLIVVPAAQGQVSPNERNALIALYNATNGGGWSDNSGWLGGPGTECTWYGVTCLGSQVWYIDLGGNNLGGSIPADLSQLLYLSDLDLTGNHIAGPIPPALGMLSSLTSLRLGGNTLSGPIPPGLGDLSGLLQLDLSGNYLSGSIPSEIGDIATLGALRLGSNGLTGSIPPELGSIASLHTLELTFNDLTGSIPPELGTTSLQLVRIAYNQLSGSIPPELGNLRRLEHLDLRGNQLSGTLPAELGDLSSLQELHLYENQLSGSIPPEFGNLESLLNVQLHSNALTGQIPSELGKLSGLYYLWLQDNQLSGEIPVSLVNLSSLTSLDICLNQLFTDDPDLRSFLNTTAPGWESCQRPTVRFNWAPLTPHPGELIQFTDDSTSSPTSWSWDFDDGGSSTDQNPSHAFASSGTYTVSLEATNSAGTGQGSAQLTVGVPPAAEFNWTPTTPQPGEMVNFTDASTGSPDSWSWDFGDGGSSAVQDPSHLFSAAGSYSVELTVSNAFGSDVISHDVPVGGSPVANFTWSPDSPSIGELVEFSDQSIGNPTWWSWDFGDNEASTEQSPFHAFAATGTYTVTLSVGNDVGTDAVSHAVTVGAPPVAAFSFYPSQPVVGETIWFTDQSSGEPTSWEWDFGDGARSSNQNPTHVYTAVGTYTVTLTASNSHGSNTTALDLISSPGPPVASFTWAPGSPLVDEAIQFTDMSEGEPTQWSWVFGDGGSSTEQHPTHLYSAAGTYTVGLTVTNPSGDDGTNRTLVVREDQVEPPVARDETTVSTEGGEVGRDSDSDTDRSGNRVVVWQQTGGRAKELTRNVVETTNSGIFARYYDSRDIPVGGIIEAYVGAEARNPTVSFDGSGNFVIGWQTGGGDDRILGRYYDHQQSPLTPVFEASEGAEETPESPRAAAAAAGDFVMAWRASGTKQAGEGIFGRFFDPDGSPKGSTIQVSQAEVDSVSTPAVAVDAVGNAIVIWHQEGSAKQSEDGVFGRYFDPTGDAEGEPFQVNDESTGATLDPSVGVAAGGEVAVVWAQDTGSDSGWDIHGRLIGTHGQFEGIQFMVNTDVAGDQTVPSVAVNAAGDIAVAWESGADGIFGRFFTAGGLPLGPEFVMVQTEGGLVPTSPEVSVAGDDTITVSYTRVDAGGVARGVYFTSFEVPDTAGACDQDVTTSCLNYQRFQAQVSWKNFQANTGAGQAVPLTDDTGYFWFFDQANVELMLKVLDGTGVNGHFWVFYGALSNVEYTIVITDTVTGSSKTYSNPSETFASVGDTEALPSSGKAVHGVVDVPTQEWPGTVVEGFDPAAKTLVCTPGPPNLCLNASRFMVEVEWEDFQGNTGSGQAVPLTADTGYFWFFNDANVELVIKVLDGRGINQHFWVFYGALSNVEYTITVTDTVTGAVRTYINPPGVFGSVGDTEAFYVP